MAMAMAMAESKGRTNESMQDDEKGRSVDAGVSTPTSVSMRSRPGGSCRESLELRFKRGRGCSPKLARMHKGEDENRRSKDADVLAVVLASTWRC